MSPSAYIVKDLVLFGFLPFFLPQQCSFLWNQWSQITFGPFSVADNSDRSGVKCSILLSVNMQNNYSKALALTACKIGAPFLKP